jgi:phage terminase Nu1 subunit (DNA packaging protein)
MVDPTPPPAALSVTQEEAAKLTRLSAKTLGRMADRGEPVGRIKVGRKVVYHVPTLSAWLAARATPSSPAPTA